MTCKYLGKLLSMSIVNEGILPGILQGISLGVTFNNSFLHIPLPMQKMSESR